MLRGPRLGVARRPESIWTRRKSQTEQPLFSPIDEQLRYLIPFRPPAEFAEYIRGLGQRGQSGRLAVLADDGEKFGGWPGTFDWVYQKGWLKEFLATLDALRDAAEIRLVTFSTALAEVPSERIAYLPSASYHEMEGWALPTPAARRLAMLEAELGLPVVTNPSATFWAGLRQLGLHSPTVGWGRLIDSLNPAAPTA